MSSSMKFDRVVILGDTGFIGSRLKAAFRALEPSVEVIGYSRHSSCDLRRPESLSRLSKHLDADTLVLMCAALKRQFGDTPEAFTQNMQMTIHLCGLLEERPVKRVIFFSSSAVYGEDIHNTDISEDTLVQPTSYYGMAKHASERMYYKAIGSRPDSSLLVLRPPLIYGPGDRGQTYGPVKFACQALKEEEIVLWGDGRELREFVYIDDIIRAVIQLASSPAQGVLNVVSGRSYTFMDILDIVTGLSPHPVRTASRTRTKDKVDNVFSNSRFREVVKDFSFTPLDEGVRKTFDAFAAENHSVLKGAI